LRKVFGGVISEGLAQLSRHEAGIAGGGEQMLQAGKQLLSGSDLGGEASADARAERDQLFAPEFLQ
jgi:hypothetical protein